MREKIFKLNLHKHTKKMYNATIQFRKVKSILDSTSDLHKLLTVCGGIFFSLLNDTRQQKPFYEKISKQINNIVQKKICSC